MSFSTPYSVSSSSVVSLTSSFTSLWVHCFKPEYSFSQWLWCISRIILTVTFLKKYVHFSKHFIQTAPHNGLPAKACNLLKIFSSSLKSKYLSMNISVPSEGKVLVSLFTIKMLHIVNITLHSFNLTWRKLWQQFGGQLLYWKAEACTSYVCHISIQKYTFTHYCMWNIDWKRLDMIHSYTFTSGLTKKQQQPYNVIVK